MRILITAALLGLWTAAAAADAPALGPPLDAARLGGVTFSEECDRPLDVWDAQTRPRGVWKTNYFHSDQNGFSSRNLAGNGDEQVYSDKRYNGVDPFEVKGGACDIKVDVDRDRANPRNGNAPYTSGYLSTEKSFAQTYGYWEMRATLPQGKGMWPAFWMWSRRFAEGHEIDILENVEDGRDYGGYVDWSVRTVTEGQPGLRWKVVTPAATDRPHTYGLLWTHERLCYYLDRRERGCTPNPGFDSPMFLMLNVAVGGKWAGEPPADTRWPQRMSVDYIRVYALKP